MTGTVERYGGHINDTDTDGRKMSMRGALLGGIIDKDGRVSSPESMVAMGTYAWSTTTGNLINMITDLQAFLKCSLGEEKNYYLRFKFEMDVTNSDAASTDDMTIHAYSAAPADIYLRSLADVPKFKNGVWHILPIAEDITSIRIDAADWAAAETHSGKCFVQAVKYGCEVNAVVAVSS